MRLILAEGVPDVDGGGDLEVTRVADAARVLAALNDEVVLVALPLRAPADADVLPSMAAHGAMVLGVAGSESEEMRASALQAGARDVLFPPHDSVRLQDAIHALLGGKPPRRDRRYDVDLPGVLGGAEARIKNVSRGGFLAESATPPARGAVVRITLPELSLADGWARVLAVDGRAVHARFLALTSAEQRALDAFLQSRV